MSLLKYIFKFKYFPQVIFIKWRNLYECILKKSSCFLIIFLILCYNLQPSLFTLAMFSLTHLSTMIWSFNPWFPNTQFTIIEIILHLCTLYNTFSLAGLLIEPLFISTNNEKIRSVYINRSVCYSWFPEKRLFNWLCAVRWIDSADIKGVQFANPFHEPHSIQIKILHINTTNSETYLYLLLTRSLCSRIQGHPI